MPIGQNTQAVPCPVPFAIAPIALTLGHIEPNMSANFSTSSPRVLRRVNAFSLPTRTELAWFFGSMCLWMFKARPVHACSCEQISPAEGFDRAKYVFTGTVAETSGHTWIVDVNRAWKGADRLAGQVHLPDVNAM
jgi:hypothetical protein